MKRPLVNLLSLLTGDLGSRLIGFFISVYLARVLEPTGFGLLNVGLAVLGYLQLAGSPGIQVLETRNAAAFVEVNRERVNAVLSVRLVLAIGLLALSTLVVFAFVADDLTRQVILMFSLAVIPLALMLDWFFQGKESFSPIGGSRLIQYVAYGIVVVLLVHHPSDAYLAGLAFLVGTVAAAAMLWVVYQNRWGSITLSWSPTMWKEILTKGIPVGAAMLLAQSVTNLPPLLIGYFSSSAEVGLFSSAMKLVFLLMLIDRLLNALFLPAVTRYFSSKSGELTTFVETALRTVMALVIPLSILGSFLSGVAITVVFGGSYESASPLLSILMSYFALTVLNSVFICILIGSGHEREYTRAVSQGSIALCIAVVLGTVLWSAHGAAWGIVLGELLTVTLMVRESGKLVRISTLKVLARPIFAGVCMAGAAFLLTSTTPVVLVIIPLMVFVVVEILLKGITAREFRFLRERFV